MKLKNIIYTAFTFIFIAISFLISTKLFSFEPTEDFYEAEIIEIIEGDTFKIRYEKGTSIVRLIGVDCFETENNSHSEKQAKQFGIEVQEVIEMGKLAKNFVRSLLTEQKNIVVSFDREINRKYEIPLVYILYGEEDFTKMKMLNEVILENGYGFAFKYDESKYGLSFLAKSRNAKEKKLGLWWKLEPVENEYQFLRFFASDAEIVLGANLQDFINSPIIDLEYKENTEFEYFINFFNDAGVDIYSDLQSAYMSVSDPPMKELGAWVVIYGVTPDLEKLLQFIPFIFDSNEADYYKLFGTYDAVKLDYDTLVVVEEKVTMLIQGQDEEFIKRAIETVKGNRANISIDNEFSKQIVDVSKNSLFMVNKLKNSTIYENIETANNSPINYFVKAISGISFLNIAINVSENIHIEVDIVSENPKTHDYLNDFAKHLNFDTSNIDANKETLDFIKTFQVSKDNEKITLKGNVSEKLIQDNYVGLSENPFEGFSYLLEDAFRLLAKDLKGPQTENFIDAYEDYIFLFDSVLELLSYFFYF